MFPIAEIYPLRPMPRRMGVFDYAIPENVTCARGDVVEIPLRGRTVAGIVARVGEREDVEKLKSISRVVASGFLSDAELGFFETLAKELVQSPSSVLDAAISLPPKRATKEKPFPALPLTLPADEAPLVRATIERLNGLDRAFICVPDLRRTAALVSAFLDAHPAARLVLVAPNVRDAELLRTHLGRFAPVFLSGTQTANARFRAWDAARRGASRLLIGSRLAALVPFPGMTALWVVRSGHSNHKNADKNPRYDTRHVSRLAAARFGAQLIWSDAAPGPEEVHMAGEHLLDPFTRPDTVFADTSVKRAKTDHPLLGPTLLERLQETLDAGRKAVCVYNRVGTANAVRCTDCGFGFPCPNCHTARVVEPDGLRCRQCDTRDATPRNCPICHGWRVERRGFGNQSVAAALRTALPNATIAVIDKETPPPLPLAGEETLLPSVILVTQHYLENLFDPFQPDRIGLVALLDADASLRSPGFRGTEHALRDAAEWRGLAHACRATFLLQTDRPDVFRDGLGDPITWARGELAGRVSYGLPPAVHLIRFTCRQHPPAEARRALLHLMEELHGAFPDLALREAPSAPGTFSAEWSVPSATFPATLAALRSTDDACLIDIDPIL